MSQRYYWIKRRTSEQRILPPVRHNLEIFVSQLRSHAPPRSPIKKSNLHQKRLVNLLNRLWLFRQSRGQGVHPHRPTLILLNNRQQQTPVDFIKSILIHFQHAQSRLRRRLINFPRPANLRIIANPPQQPVRNARRPPRPARDLDRTRVVDRHTQNFRRPFHNHPQLCRRVELQAQHNSKSRPQWRRQQPRPRGSTHEGKRLHLERMRPRRRPLPNNDVQLVIFQRRIKQFFQHRLQPVNLVDEQHLLVLQVRDNRGQVTFDLHQRRRRRLKVHPQLIGDDVRQRSLPQSRRPVQQHMIHGLPPRPRRLNRDRQVLLHLRLPNKLAQPLRTQLQLKRRVILNRSRRNQPLPAVIQIRIIFCRSHSPDVTTKAAMWKHGATQAVAWMSAASY